MTILESELHAYIDDQLADEERAIILAEMCGSAELSRQVAELQMLKDLIQVAYPPVVQPRHQQGGCMVGKR